MQVLAPYSLHQISGGTQKSKERVSPGLLDGIVLAGAYYYHRDLKKAINTYQVLRPILDVNQDDHDDLLDYRICS